MMNNYASMHVLVQSIPIFIMCMSMGLVSRVDSMLVASSSLVEGLGMLQCGIRAHVVAWASMGHEEAVTEARLPSTQQQKK